MCLIAGAACHVQVFDLEWGKKSCNVHERGGISSNSAPQQLKTPESGFGQPGLLCEGWPLPTAPHAAVG